VSSPNCCSWFDIYYCLTVTVLFLLCALSDERARLSFVYAAGLRQDSLSRVRVPWDSWPYFTLSVLWLPVRRLLRLVGSRWRYSSPPPHGSFLTTYNIQSQSHIATDGQSVSKSWCRAQSGTHDQIFLTMWQLRSCSCRSPSLTRGRVCPYIYCLPLPTQSFFGSSPLGHETIFYCVSFENSLFVASCDSQGHGGGIRARVHTEALWLPTILSWAELYVTTDGQPASLSWNKALIWGLRPDLYYFGDSYGLVLVGRHLWREDGSVFYICCLPLQAQSIFGPSPLGLAIIFYCLRFETSLFVASYDSQGHGGCIRSRLHTGIPDVDESTTFYKMP
jgi:hypothetical protein